MTSFSTHATRLYIPSGAVCGTDGLRSAAAELQPQIAAAANLGADHQPGAQEAEQGSPHGQQLPGIELPLPGNQQVREQCQQGTRGDQHKQDDARAQGRIRQQAVPQQGLLGRGQLPGRKAQEVSDVQQKSRQYSEERHGDSR